MYDKTFTHRQLVYFRTRFYVPIVNYLGVLPLQKKKKFPVASLRDTSVAVHQSRCTNVTIVEPSTDGSVVLHPFDAHTSGEKCQRKYLPMRLTQSRKCLLRDPFLQRTETDDVEKHGRLYRVGIHTPHAFQPTDEPGPVI